MDTAKEPLIDKDEADEYGSIPSGGASGVVETPEESGTVASDESGQVREYNLPSLATEIVAQLSWDYCDLRIADLDVSVMAFDTRSRETEVAFFNNRTICDGAVAHSGDDSADGGGNNESITILLHMLPPQIHCLFFVVNCHEGGSFLAMEKGEFKLLLDGATCYSYYLETGFDATALVIGALFRDRSTRAFKFTVVEDKGTGLNFHESRYLVERHLHKIYSSALLKERPRHPDTTYSLSKGECYNFDEDVSYVQIGLGWDPADDGANVDVDGAVVLFDADKRKIADVFGKDDNQDYKYLDEMGSEVIAVKHSGDNTTGEGLGDDEEIHLFLGMMDPKVAYIAVVVNIFEGADDFGAIRRCFVRLESETGNELCRYELNEAVSGNGLVMGYFFLNAKREWRFLPTAKGCIGRRVADITDAIRTALPGGFDVSQVAAERQSQSEPVESSDCCCVVL